MDPVGDSKSVDDSAGCANSVVDSFDGANSVVAENSSTIVPTPSLWGVVVSLFVVVALSIVEDIVSSSVDSAIETANRVKTTRTATRRVEWDNIAKKKSENT